MFFFDSYIFCLHNCSHEYANVSIYSFHADNNIHVFKGKSLRKINCTTLFLKACSTTFARVNVNFIICKKVNKILFHL